MEDLAAHMTDKWHPDTSYCAWSGQKSADVSPRAAMERDEIN